MLVGKSSGKGFRYNGCVIDQNIFISGVQCGEHLEPSFGLEGEQGTIVCLWGFVAAGLMMVRVSNTLPIVEGALVAVLPLGVLGTLRVRGRSVMVWCSRSRCRSLRRIVKGGQ